MWSEEGRLQPGETIIEMLEGAAEQYDFAVVILAKDDVMTGREGYNSESPRQLCLRSWAIHVCYRAETVLSRE